MINAVTLANVATWAKLNLNKIAINNITVTPIIMKLSLKIVTIVTANNAPIMLPIAWSETVLSTYRHWVALQQQH